MIPPGGGLDPLTIVWSVLVVGALVSGVAFVGVLVVRRDAELVVAIIGVAGFGLSAYSLVTLSGVYDRLDAVLYGFAFMAAALAGGYALASSLLERVAGRPPRPARNSSQSKPATTAVILVSCVEPEEYDPKATAGMLSELAAEELLEPSLGALPFLFFAQKARYRAIGGTSPASAEMRTLTERMEAPLASLGVDLVLAANCSGRDALAIQVAHAMERGCRTVVIGVVAVAESLHLSAAKAEVASLRAEDSGVRVAYVEALGSSDRVVERLASRVLATVGDSPAGGAVLVGHGQPEERSERDPGFDEAETAFLNRIRRELVDRGMAEANVRVAWAEWGVPDVTSTTRHLAALGCRRIAVLPAVFPFDCIGTRLDIEVSVRQARVDDQVSVVTLPAWRDDDAVLTELRERVAAVLR